MSTVRILLVDDHAIVREGYRSLLNHQPGMRIVAEAANGESAYPLYQEHTPDLVLMDLSLPGKGGLATLIQIRQYDPQARILVFSMHQNPAMAKKAIDAGARGYVTKSSEPEVLIQAIKDVMNGQVALSNDMAQSLARQQLGGNQSLLESLTAREMEILRLVVEGNKRPDIADILHISPKTVANSHYIIKRKLDVDSDLELLRLAVQVGLIPKSALD